MILMFILTFYFFLLKGQVNNLLEDNMSEQKSDIAEPIERVKPIATTTPK